MADRLLRVALTGGIATGKSYCASQFGARGAEVLDADELARGAVAPGTPGLAAVAGRFGPGVLRADGSLNRPALAAIVFGNAQARADLEAIVHPAVYRAIHEWFDAVEREAPAGAVAVASVPLLYETGREDDFDVVVVAACAREQQIQRLMARDGLSLQDARQRVASQWPIEEKVRRAEHVIDTSGTFKETEQRVEDVWRRLVEQSTSGVAD